MRVVQLTTENVKRIKAVSVAPTTNVVVVSGRNGQGKSSLLDSMWYAIVGGAALKDTPEPIREGEHRALVEVDLGDLLVTRRWTHSGTTLEVRTNPKHESEENPPHKFATPQAVLDGLAGKFGFDPHAFARMKAREQVEMLLSCVELPFDLAALDQQRQDVFEKRTEENRNAKVYAAQLEALSRPAPDVPDEEVSAGSLVTELDIANGLNTDRESRIAAAAAAQTAVAQAEAALVVLRAAVTEADARLADSPESVDTEEIRARIEAIDATNAAVRDKKRYQDVSRKLRSHTDLADLLTSSLEDVDREKAEGLAAAKMPLPGLSFNDEGVLYQGVPFSQASASEQLRVGVAIAMSLNPQIRVLRIADGSLLDDANMAMLDEMAAANDFQIWVERVDDTGSVGIVIEDGEVVNQPRVAARSRSDAHS